MMKPTWVKIDKVYTMDRRDAQPYWGTDFSVRKAWTLDSPSLRALKDYVRARQGRPFLSRAISSTADAAQAAREASSSIRMPLGHALNTYTARPSRQLVYSDVSISASSHGVVSGRVTDVDSNTDERQALLPISQSSDGPKPGRHNIGICQRLWSWARCMAVNIVRSVLWTLRFVGRLCS